MKKHFTKSTKKESSVIFIDEEEEVGVPLLKSGYKNKRKLSNNSSNSNLKRQFPSSFKKYLFSENSVLIRLFTSLCPPLFSFKRISVDFEGAFLSVFLLTSTVFWGFVNSKTATRPWAFLYAISLCFGYVGIVSFMTFLISKCTKTYITLRQIFCVLCYGLFGHSLTLLFCELISAEWFMILLIVLGGLDSARIALILFARTPIPAFRFVLCTPISIIHLLYLVYLHFAIMKKKY